MVKRKRDANKIIVVGLPEGTDNEALEAMFADIGKVYAAHVVGLDDSTGTSKGYGFVTFAEAESCNMAIEKMHKTVIEGRTINVRMVEERDPNEVKGRDSNKVIVAGLTQTMTDEKLQEMCEEFGLVLKANVVRNDNGKSKGFGFVTFTNRTCQQACILKLDKRKLGGGRILNVRAVDARQPEGATAGPNSSAEAASTNKKTAPGDDVNDGKEGICIRFQMNKCHRGKGCRWKHIKIPDFEKVSKKELQLKKDQEETSPDKKSKSKVDAKDKKSTTLNKIDDQKKGTTGKMINGKMVIINENDTEDEDELSSDDSSSEEEQESLTEMPLAVQGANKKAQKSKPSQAISSGSSDDDMGQSSTHNKAMAAGVTVFDDDDDDDDDDEDIGMAPKQTTSFVSFEHDDDDDEEDEDISAMNNLSAMKKKQKTSEFESNAFDDDSDDDSDDDKVNSHDEEESTEESSKLKEESKKSLALMDSILGGEASGKKTDKTKKTGKKEIGTKGTKRKVKSSAVPDI